MNRNWHVSRRRFVEGAATAAFGVPLLVSSKAFGANDEITSGVIGIGGPAKGAGGTRKIAVCDVRKDKLGPFLEGKGVAVYFDFRELLARDDVDVVFIGTPDHWHAIPAIEAARAGKDVYCEKPMSLTIREARAMVNAVRRYDRVFQTGSQQRSSYGGKFKFAVEMVRSGRIGELKKIHVNVGGSSRPCGEPPEPTPDDVDWNTWLGPAPWRPFNRRILTGWRAYRDYSGGGMTDWGAHHFDVAQWALDKDDSGPVEIIPPNGSDVHHLTYVYDNGVEVLHRSRPFGGIVFEGTAGEIRVSRQVLETEPASVMQKPIGPDEVHVYDSTQEGHFGNFVRCVRTREKPVCDVEIGCRSVTVCHLGNIAYWLRRPLKWDPVREEFIGDEEANRWRTRAKREPWRI
ncbi:MAG: Gfo/Idh/MocA family protein [Planctomycetota bacterium]|jgi:predicted dehydrogenase